MVHDLLSQISDLCFILLIYDHFLIICAFLVLVSLVLSVKLLFLFSLSLYELQIVYSISLPVDVQI